MLKIINKSVVYKDQGNSYQEDAYIHKSFKIGGQKIYMFGVFDGHAGERVSYALRDRFTTFFKNMLTDTIKENDESVVKIWSNLKYMDAFIKETFLAFDLELYNSGKIVEDGSTAVVVFIPENPEMQFIYISNLGDSRVTIFDSAKNKVMQSIESANRNVYDTKDHKPKDSFEKRRIYRAGGYVKFTYGTERVNGQLAVSRGFGDFYLKKKKNTDYQPDPEKQKVSAQPDNYFINLEKTFTFPINVVLGTDGFYDFIQHDNLLNWFTSNNDMPLKASDLYKPIEKLSQDNVTILVFQINI